jgi:hypothetical protein
VVKKIFTGQPGGSRRKGRPRLRWVDDLEEDLKKIGIRGWRRMAEDREGWCRLLQRSRPFKGCSTTDDDDDNLNLYILSGPHMDIVIIYLNVFYHLLPKKLNF